MTGCSELQSEHHFERAPAEPCASPSPTVNNLPSETGAEPDFSTEPSARWLHEAFRDPHPGARERWLSRLPVNFDREPMPDSNKQKSHQIFGVEAEQVHHQMTVSGSFV